MEKATARGSYKSLFVDLVKTHQVLRKESCKLQTIKERLTANGTEVRPLMLLCAEGTLFVKHWDLNIIQDFQNLPSDSSMFCGAVMKDINDFISAYTYVESVEPILQSIDYPSEHSSHTKERHQEHFWPIIGVQPLHRKGIHVRLRWRALPLLFVSSLFMQMKSCNLDQFLILDNKVQGPESSLSQRIYSSKWPVCYQNTIAYREFMQQSMEDVRGLPRDFFDLSKLSVLGIYDNTDYAEIIAKFGNLAALQWALQDK